ncbi:MAG: copper amine oxidase N-terminal domain-containing protein [Defluviitaleaceae bacterium]|nr:copper amine oxidase N-terminal domain-containing protein [Defluviitaleaceae bacterium]
MVRLCIKIIGLVLCSALLAAPLTTQASDVIVIVDGQPVFFEDIQPSIVDGRTMVPLRGVFETMGYVVNWDDDTSTAILNNHLIGVTVRIGDPFITVHGVRRTGDVPPQIQDGRFMLPLRLVAESTGATVEWIEDARTVSITTANLLTGTDLEHLPLAEPLHVTPMDISMHVVDLRKISWEYERDRYRGIEVHADHRIINNTGDCVAVVNFSTLEIFDGVYWRRLPHASENPNMLFIVNDIVGYPSYQEIFVANLSFSLLLGPGLYRIRQTFAPFISSWRHSPFKEDQHDLVAEFFLPDLAHLSIYSITDNTPLHPRSPWVPGFCPWMIAPIIPEGFEYSLHE